VTETDIAISGSAASSIRAIVDFPAPDGEDRTNRTPRRASFEKGMPAIAAAAATGQRLALRAGAPL
jgi:hypothetical protein